MVDNAIKYFLLTILIVSSNTAYSQSSQEISLQKALLEIAIQHKLSLIFNPDNVENIQVSIPSKDLDVDSKLNNLLSNTSLVYKLEDQQIFLYRKRRIYGYIEDASSGERLIAANIYSRDEEKYFVANEFGHFTISTIQDSVQLEVSYIGYATKTISVKKDEMERSIILSLSPDNDVEQILITDAMVSNDERQYIDLDKGSDILIFQNQANSSIGGEPDFFQSMIRQTGVNAGTDGFGGIHVRGGKNDQNLILFDGVKIYNPSHAFGVYSIINSSVIDQATIHKNGASGDISGRLSSIIDIKSKDPDLYNFRLSGQVSTLASQATVDIPVVKGKLGVTFTGRTTHVSPFIASLSDKSKDDLYTKGELTYGFNDFNFKTYAKLSNSSRLYLTLYRATDSYQDSYFYDDTENGFFTNITDNVLNYNWQNNLANLRFNTTLSDNTFMNVQGSYYEYRYDTKEVANAERFNFESNELNYFRDFIKSNSGIENIDLKVNFQSIFFNHYLKYGVTLSKKTFNVGNYSREDITEDSTEPKPENNPLLTESSGKYLSNEVVVHISDKFKVSDDWIFEAAIYATYIDSRDVVYEDTLQSHLVTHGYIQSKYLINKNLSFGGSIGSTIQTEHLLTVGDNGYPNDVWVPSTMYTPPARSNQAELFGEFRKGEHTTRLSGYYKKQIGLIFYDTSPSLPSLSDFVTPFWEVDNVLGNADGWGIELDYTFLRKDVFSFHGVYTYGTMDYQFDLFNEGKPFPYDFAIPHTISLGANVFLKKRWALSLDWYYASGKPYTLYESDVIFSPLEKDNEQDIYQVSRFNELLGLASHKLSFSISTFWHWGSVRNDFSLGIQNVYNRRNELYTYNLYDSYYGTLESKSQQGFPLLPILKWRIDL